VGGDLGGAVKSFKEAVKEEEKTPKIDASAQQTGQTIEGEVKNKTVS
jgi:sec-independent protein translocase protein TatA